MAMCYLWFLNTWGRTWRTVLWSHSEHWASETTGTFSSLELLLGIIWGVEAAWHFDLSSFKILPAIITEIWETANTSSRFLRLQEETWRPQNISGTPHVVALKTGGSLQSQIPEWSTPAESRCSAGELGTESDLELALQVFPFVCRSILRAANSRSPVLHRSLSDEQGKVLNAPQKYFPFNKCVDFFLI